MPFSEPLSPPCFCEVHWSAHSRTRDPPQAHWSWQQRSLWVCYLQHQLYSLQHPRGGILGTRFARCLLATRQPRDGRAMQLGSADAQPCPTLSSLLLPRALRKGFLLPTCTNLHRRSPGDSTGIVWLVLLAGMPRASSWQHAWGILTFYTHRVCQPAPLPQHSSTERCPSRPGLPPASWRCPQGTLAGRCHTSAAGSASLGT